MRFALSPAEDIRPLVNCYASPTTIRSSANTRPFYRRRHPWSPRRYSRKESLG